MKTPTHRLSLIFIVALFVSLALHRPAGAEFMQPELVPVERLIKNAEARLAKNPADAKAQYTLARIHYLAFHIQHDHAPAFARGGDGGEPAPQWMLGWATNDKNLNEKGAVKLKDEEMIDHAAKALKGFNEALKLDPKNGLYALGLASLMEEFSTWKDAVKPASVPAGLSNITPAALREAYARAMTLSLPGDLKEKYQPVSGIQSLTSYEAATALVRLASKGDLDEAGKKQVEVANNAIEKIKALPMGPVTPIVFSFQQTAHLSDILDPQHAVDFDLRGYGWHEQWSWVKPELGLLVWDPAHTGRITSARQLFGVYTFQIFRDTGYDALAALDDNGDGLLSGSELEGISVWFDRNCDAKSSPEEVTPLLQIGVVSLSVKAESFDGIHPMNARGIAFQDGRVLPTWDWIAEPVREKPERLASAKR